MPQSDSKHLKSLGSKKTTYALDKPRPEILESFKNQHTNEPYLVPFTMPFPEFTSLCPKTGQPDFARIEIIYVPDKLMVESKSLKLYLFSFRNSGEFHEDVCNRIANDLEKLMKPLYLRVFGDFSPRGGLAIKPLVERWGTKGTMGENYEWDGKIQSLVDAWDRKRV